MKHYIDIEVLPSVDYSNTVLMNTLFSKVHPVLYEYGNNEIGISFPNFKKNLGNILRIHGKKENLSAFINNNWLSGMRDLVNHSDILEIPNDVKYRTVTRERVNNSVDRLRRRKMKREGISEETAKKLIPSTEQKNLSLPYINVHSKSNQQYFRIYIKHIIQDKQVTGNFDNYGLSSSATIPWF